MAHGGVRYLEQMFKLKGDALESYNLLRETLQERSYFLQAVPYQNKEL
jgi:glycerol-3-phosphate dehydrogenase